MRISTPASVAMDERVLATGKAVYVLDLAVRTAAAVLERDGHCPLAERHLVSPELGEQLQALAADPVDVGGRSDRGRRPEHERRFGVFVVAETAGANPGER